jgi:opacity protein-like surface antigen
MLARLTFAAVLLMPLLPLRAGEAAGPEISGTSAVAEPADTTPAFSKIKSSYEFNADTSYTGNARTNFGAGAKGNVSELDSGARFVVSPQYNDGPIFRFGLAMQHYSFGLSRGAPLPDTLQSENVIVGMDFTFLDSWLIRVEADPGFYNDLRATGFRDFNVPFILGGSYIASEDLQWVVGLEVDFNRQIPVYPGLGVRWSIIDGWVLDAILPTPRLEYDWSKSLTLYLGGDVEEGTYRVASDFGTNIGRPELNNAVTEYDEVRVGAGLSWKASKAVTFELEGGYLPFREFDFHRADTHFSNDDGAPYCQVSLNAQF